MFSSSAENKNVPLTLSASAIANGKNAEGWQNLTKEIAQKSGSNNRNYILISLKDIDKTLFEKTFNCTPEDLQLEKPSGNKLYWLCEDKEKNRFICFSKEGYVHYKSPYLLSGSLLAMEIYQACVERENKIKIINEWCPAQNKQINYIFTDHAIDVAKTVEAFYTQEIKIFLSKHLGVNTDKFAARIISAMKSSPLMPLHEYHLEAALGLFRSVSTFAELEFSESAVMNSLILSMQNNLLAHFKAVMQYMDKVAEEFLCVEPHYKLNVLNAMTPFMARYICDHQMDWLSIEDNSLTKLADCLGSENVYVQTYLVLLAILKKDELMTNFLEKLFVSLSSNDEDAKNFIQNNFLQAIEFAWNANNPGAVDKIFDFVRKLIENKRPLAENCYNGKAEIKMRNILSDSSVIGPEKIGSLISFLSEIADKLPEVQEYWENVKNAIFCWCVDHVQNKEDFAAMGKMLRMPEVSWSNRFEYGSVIAMINSEEGVERLFDDIKNTMPKEKKNQYLKNIAIDAMRLLKEFMAKKALDLLPEKEVQNVIRHRDYELLQFAVARQNVEMVMFFWEKLTEEDKKEARALLDDLFEHPDWGMAMYNFDVEFPEDKQSLSMGKRV